MCSITSTDEELSQPYELPLPKTLCKDGSSVKKCNVLLGITGSVATIKTVELVAKLRATNVCTEVAIVPTEKALKFLTSEDLASLESAKIWTDADEWSMWRNRGDPVLHIDLGKWADVLILAPLDANTLAKISNGLCDNLLTCVVRAWEIQRKPVLFCPAMNTKMWSHPLTSVQIEQLKSFNYVFVPPVEKTLMCGDVGIGAMALVDTIVQRFVDTVSERSSSQDSSFASAPNSAN